MDMPYEPVALGPSGRLYLRNVLRKGLTIATLATDSNDFAYGQCISFLPRGIDAGTMTNYSYGGIASSQASRKALVQFLKGLDERYHHSLIVFENRYARPEDPFLRRCRSRVIAIGEEVYHVADTNDSEDSLLTALTESAAAIETGIMIFALSEEEKRSFLSNPSFKGIGPLVLKCIGIAVGAYDGEGYIIWLKANRSEQGPSSPR